MPILAKVETLSTFRSIRYLGLRPLARLCHGLVSSGRNPSRKGETRVAVFWDLDNKPPNSYPPYEAAVRLRAVASSFGIVRSMVAYANSRSLSYVPPVVRDQRKERRRLDKLETEGVIRPPDPYLCRVCGRKFYTNEKLVNHFREIHERENAKRVSQIESARGKRRVNLVAKYSMKMEKYKRAVRDVLTPKVGYGLADELKQAGFWVRTVSENPQAADMALRNHMVDVMDHRRADCLVLVSDDSDFVNVLKEAKMRCLRTVVVGDLNDGLLKRVADSGFSWRDILMGKARKEAPSVMSRWNDQDILKRLEWTYNPEVDKNASGFDFVSDSEGEDVLGPSSDGPEPEDFRRNDHGAWWELDSSTEVTSTQGLQGSSKSPLL
ncbi:hypothetical protein MLD38_015453 [Melastoma candidum]|uniref:Uncharacterized protein n=1 Tax=Melastoma candidum TaxID=119954 RepID=A0ACB9RG22_9MYRT|nr:hypothetical protein MLD38_015453 [Melastoma candidum]